MRTDLKNKDGQKVRSGKLIAQGAHASLKVILDSMDEEPNETSQGSEGNVRIGKSLESGTAMHDWIQGIFTKICLGVKSEDELLLLYEKAKNAGLPCAIIKDAGLTEFAEPTYTCMAIGPAWSDEVDAVTKGLSLF